MTRPYSDMRRCWLVTLLLAAGCAGGDRLTAPAPAPEPGTPRAAPTAPPIALGGRWMLSSPGVSSCAVTIGAAPSAGEGTVAPEGGCPGNFFTTRKWSFEGGALVLRDHTGEPLGQLSPAPPGRYEGQSKSGMAITLAR